MTALTLGAEGQRVAYLVKRYPRFSETFIVNEILAHEEAGLEMDIFSLKPSNDTHFQDAIARVRAPVRVLPHSALKAATFWNRLGSAQSLLPKLHERLAEAWQEDVVHTYQAVVLAQAIRQQGITHLHAHFGSSPATVARLAARFADISYSFTAHAKDLYHESVDLEAFVRRHRDYATIVTVSDFNRHFLVDEAGFRPEQVVRIYNGLDLDRFRYAEPALRPRRIVAIGRLVEKKGFRDLIDACSVLRSAQVKFECRIIGSGPLEYELANQIRECNLREHVSLLGSLPQEVIREELQQAAVFAAPCIVAGDGDRDGVPTTLLEAMALGVPCISTDVTGIPEVVVDGGTGIVVPQRDPKALADAVGRLLDRPNERINYSVEARALISEKFDARINTQLLRDVFFGKGLMSRAEPASGRGLGMIELVR